MKVSQFQNNYLQRKQEDQYLVQNAIVILISFQWLYATNFLIPYFFLSCYTCSFEVWGTYDRTDAKKWEKEPIEKIHTQFYKHFIGLDERATNIVSRNEGRLSLKSHINISHKILVTSFLIYLANNGRPSFMLSFHEIMKLHCSTRILVETNLVNSKLPKIKQAIIDYFKKDQMNMLRTYKKLNCLSLA